MLGNSIGRLSLGVVIILLSGITACGDSPGSAADARDEAFAEIGSRDVEATYIRYASTLRDYLPGRKVIVDGGEPKPTANGIVHGDILSAEVAGAWVIEGGLDGTPVPLDDPRADWRMVAVTLDVSQAWGSAVPQRGVVTCGLTIDPSVDTDAFIRGIEEIGSSLVVLNSLGYYKENPEFYRVALEGAALGMVRDGRLSFPQWAKMLTPF
jgi:hypothetical protein